MPGNRIGYLAMLSLMWAGSAEAEITASSSMVDIHIACIDEAIAAGEASLQAGSWIRFTCHGPTATVFFERLGQLGIKGSDVTNEVGTVDSRAFDPPDMCWHRVRQPDGSAADDYACALNFHGSSLLDK